ncbi:MAG TPA: S-adenosylmethionine decarboxylase [Gemmatimonadales bacterium]|nr:S-adenosylmethionine decarboxylase [Gemmatimonadales bacterium]
MSRYNHHVLELTEVVSTRLSDSGGLASIVVAAAGAVGMFALGPPEVRPGPRGIAVGMLCRDGHIVLHTSPEEGLCVVDIVARAPADVTRGLEVIARRLTAAG